KEIKMNDNLGTPFGTLISSKEITENKIDNVKYIVKVKTNTIFIIILIYLCIFLFYDYIVFYFRSFRKVYLNNRHISILILFLCFLTMPNIIYKFFPKFDSLYENRVLASKPIFSLEKISDYPLQFENYYKDNTAFRTQLIKLKRTIDILFFNHYPEDTAIYGRDHNMYWGSEISNYIGALKVTTNELLIYKNNLLNFREKLKKNNIEFVLMITPNKSFVYDENLPDFIYKHRSHMTSTEQILQYLRDNTDINIIYNTEELAKYKDKYKLYWDNDPHWNRAGAYIYYTYLIKKLNINNYILNIEDVDISKIVDLNIFCKVRNTYINKIDYDYSIRNYSTNIIICSNNYRQYSYRKSTSINDNNIIFVHDSFGASMIDFIYSYFRETRSYYLNNYNFNFNTNFYINSDTDLIIFQTVEHLLQERLLSLF
uniref:alginate O-acetyltransferase AlgX-related protein n=1 Tax=uncultured Brachyspira sp. TaxID=221953 RepID=UPI00261E3917